MTSFDFLHDGMPDAVDALRTARVPARFRALAAAALALAVATAGAWALESVRIAGAVDARDRAQERYERSRQGVAALAMQTRALDQLWARDRALRRIRSSGPLLAQRVATLGNLAPYGVWLSSVQAAETGYAIEGVAAKLPAFERFVENLLADRRAGAPSTIAVRRDERSSGPMHFDLGAGTAP